MIPAAARRIRRPARITPRYPRDRRARKSCDEHTHTLVHGAAATCARPALRRSRPSSGVSLATMSDIVDRLEAHEMVRREPDRSDHRVRRVGATAVGRDTVQRLLAARPHLSRPPLERLGGGGAGIPHRAMHLHDGATEHEELLQHRQFRRHRLRPPRRGRDHQRGAGERACVVGCRTLTRFLRRR
ncbi:MarR family transcriptional regulator [Agrococcus sp. KRD186]|uniref:MarR family transcriptional regulator n=1 Tax=Agrococcus sp. KRD186 TaxID=2729730 RepID=UPI003144ECC7